MACYWEAGWRFWGHRREGQGLWINIWAHQVVLEVTSSNYFVPEMCSFLSELSIGSDVIKVTWRGVGEHTMVCLLWHLWSTLLAGPAYNLKYIISFKVASFWKIACDALINYSAFWTGYMKSTFFHLHLARHLQLFLLDLYRSPLSPGFVTSRKD